jgi:hypothetical protein
MRDYEELIDEARLLLSESFGGAMTRRSYRSTSSSFKHHHAPVVTHKTLTPDQFRQKYGRCPIGFHTDPSTDRCAKIGQERPTDKPPAAKASATPVTVTHFAKKPAETPPPTAKADHEPKPPEHEGGKEEHGFLRKALHHVWEAVTDPFKKAWKLATDKKYRTEVKDFVVKAARKEGGQTKAMAGTFAKLLKGEKVTREEKMQAMDQMADIVKVAAMGAMVGHIAGGGIVKLAATLASPADELAGIAIDKPLRAITKKLFGREHGILPTSFYEEGVRYTMRSLLGEAYKEGDEYKLIETMVDAIMDEMAKSGGPSDKDIMQALMKSGLRAKKKNVIDKIIGMFSKKESLVARMSALL